MLHTSAWDSRAPVCKEHKFCFILGEQGSIDRPARLYRVMRRLLLASLLVVLSLPVQAANPGAVYSVPQAGPATVCFTSGNHSAPGGDCVALVVNEIGRA